VARESQPASIEARVRASGLFDHEVYLSLNPDLRSFDRAEAWEHYLEYGCDEGRHFTSPEGVARLLAEMEPKLRAERYRFKMAAEAALAGMDNRDMVGRLRRRDIRVGVFCSSVGNFFMREIADLLAWGLEGESIPAIQRDETGSPEEPFDLRVFVAPHEFFWLGAGREWAGVASAANSIMYNVEQAQTQWFGRAVPLLLKAPLVLDINFQTAEILRRAGVNAVHFMPGHLPTASYAQPCLDVSEFELLKGYDFARERYDWRERDRLDDRPIDVLFIGSATPRRAAALTRLRNVAEGHRFLCVSTRQDRPLTASNNRTTSTAINCALGQRAKIVLNIHRDWLGYFEWSRMVLQGFWQGACVVSDPGLPNPIFDAGTHYLEENPRHIGELVRWLQETAEGREKLNKTRTAGYERVCQLGSMNVALTPVLGAFRELLAS
jgi:hypothetical protein